MSLNQFFELLLQRKLSFIRVYTQSVIWWAFWNIVLTYVKIFAHFKWVWSLSFLCTTQQFVTYLFDFSVWFLKIEFNPLLDLLNTGVTIFENSLFCVRTQEAKIPGFHWQDGDVYLIRNLPVSPTCESTSNTGWVILIFYWVTELTSWRTVE